MAPIENPVLFADGEGEIGKFEVCWGGGMKRSALVKCVVAAFLN